VPFASCCCSHDSRRERWKSRRIFLEVGQFSHWKPGNSFFYIFHAFFCLKRLFLSRFCSLSHVETPLTPHAFVILLLIYIIHLCSTISLQFFGPADAWDLLLMSPPESGFNWSLESVALVSSLFIPFHLPHLSLLLHGLSFVKILLSDFSCLCLHLPKPGM